MHHLFCYEGQIKEHFLRSDSESKEKTHLPSFCIGTPELSGNAEKLLKFLDATDQMTGKPACKEGLNDILNACFALKEKSQAA